MTKKLQLNKKLEFCHSEPVEEFKRKLHSE